MTVATFLAHSLPLVLIAAVSPVLFLNASRVVEAAGIAAGLYFGGGAVLCLIALGVRLWALWVPRRRSCSLLIWPPVASTWRSRWY